MGAACAVLDREFPAINRANSYIAVMVDDLVLHGVTEPYRMLTARAEYRLRLRADNAGTRLTPLGMAVGAVGTDRKAEFGRYEAEKSDLRLVLDGKVTAETLIASGLKVKRDTGKMSMFDWLRFPDVDLVSLLNVPHETYSPPGETRSWDSNVIAELEQDGRYAPYLERQASELRDLAANERIALPADLDYHAIAGLSNEMTERLETVRPDTLAAAGRIRGITPAALATILVHAKRAQILKNSQKKAA